MRKFSLIDPCCFSHSASLVVQMIENLPAMQETQVLSQGWEDPLEKEMTTYSSILAWRIAVVYSPWGHKESVTTEQLTHFLLLSPSSDL